MGHDGEVRAGAFHISLAERDEVFAGRDFALVVVENRVLQKHHGIVVADGGLEEPLDVVGGGRADDFHARMIGEDVLGRMAVGRADIGPAVGRSPDDDGDVYLSAGHVADVGGIVQDLIERHRVEAPEHELNDGADAEHGGADAQSDKTRLADRRVDDALRPEAGQQALADLISALELPHLLTHEDDVGIAFQFFGQRLIDRFAVGDEWHRWVVHSCAIQR